MSKRSVFLSSVLQKDEQKKPEEEKALMIYLNKVNGKREKLSAEEKAHVSSQNKNI